MIIPTCIHVPANDRTLFSFMGIHSTVDINHILFLSIPLLLDTAWFHILAVVSEAVLGIDVQVSLTCGLEILGTNA